ncbi:triose-phosphate isomerase [Trinickia acidisoli]|uniref:triose-phosphate isomerase n=1 Tax=Trinickia acidisoli TaxID=2767482 RepID=UPI001A905C15|nr:triose-phosphate isomerase [Trinickia acidisoli]
MPRKRVIGNWKMNGTIASNARLLREIKDDMAIAALTIDAAVCVPFLHVSETQRILTGTALKWGVQDISAFREGAYTGEISADMVAEFGATYAIVGHSERRSHHAEALTTVGAKALRAIEAGITPVVCVGETLREREDGAARETVETQLLAVLDSLPADQMHSLVLAYEPVWAIGTGRSASPRQAQEMHEFLRRLLRTRSESLADTTILYGGSVKPAAAADLFAQNDIDGALVGGASLEAGPFLDIIRLAANHAGA